MKKLLCILLSLLCLVPLASCSDIDTSYPTRTAAFYGHMNQYNTFWFEMEFTVPEDTYTFIQATDGVYTATICKYEGSKPDTYEILEIVDGQHLIHTMNVSNKSYDTTVGLTGQVFLFEDYNSAMFNHAKSVKDAIFDGKEYYCETFSTTSGGDLATGENRYYYDGGTLVAIEVFEGDNKTMIMRFKDYGNTVPDNIYVAPPADFTKGTLNFEDVVDYSQWADSWN